MENKTIIINGVSYTCLTDEEYEDLQTVAAYEERKKSKDFKTISFDEFLKDREEKYGVKFWCWNRTIHYRNCRK